MGGNARLHFWNTQLVRNNKEEPGDADIVVEKNLKSIGGQSRSGKVRAVEICRHKTVAPKNKKRVTKNCILTFVGEECGQMG